MPRASHHGPRRASSSACPSLIRFVLNHPRIAFARLPKRSPLLFAHVAPLRPGIARKFPDRFTAPQGRFQGGVMFFLSIFHTENSRPESGSALIFHQKIRAPRFQIFPRHSRRTDVWCYLMRTYHYGRRRITASQLKRWEKMKVVLILVVGAVILSILFYLIATK
jgi:hypothetical protein